MPDFKKGASVIQEVVQSRGEGKSFRPFLPQIFWNKEVEEHYIAILNPLDEIVTVKLHPFIETDDGFNTVIAKTDDAIGEKKDPIEDDWKYAPRESNVMIAVELEPTFKNVGGRDKVSGFAVATKVVERRIRDDAGELTDEREEIDVPLVGYIAQSPFNFGNQLVSYDETEGPIDRTPFKVKKIGEKTNVNYQFLPYDGIEVDYTNLLEYLENISYVDNPEELLEAIGEAEGIEAAQEIGQYLLDRKLAEWIDPDFYDEVYKSISKPSRFGDKKATTRPKRPAQRREATSRTREPEETVSKESSAKERLKSLRAQKAAKDAAKTSATEAE